MNINIDALLKDGFTKEEAVKIAANCAEEKTADSTACLINVGPLDVVTVENCRWVCRTAAEAVDKVRPGAWLKGEGPTQSDEAHALYERLIQTDLGKTTPSQQIDAYLRALMVAAQITDMKVYQLVLDILNAHR